MKCSLGRWSIAGWVLVVMAVGCGGEDTGGLDPNKFSGMNEDKIRLDCLNTVRCAAMNNQPLSGTAVDDCVDATARFLDAHPEVHGTYLANVGRCQALVDCYYNDCALQDGQGGYGQSQADKLTYQCQQDISCAMLQGTFAGDPAAEVQNCVATGVGVLDSFTTEQRAQFESAFGACSALSACDFANCFPF